MQKPMLAIAAVLFIGPTLAAAVAGHPAHDTPSQNSSRDAARLFGKQWKLTEIRGVTLKTTRAYLEFDRDTKRFSGNGGCNRIAGGFEVSGSKLKFSQAISTKMACIDREVQQVETDFLRALEEITNFQIEAEVLRLYAGDAPLLTLKSDAPASAKVTGTITYLQRIALSPIAVIEVKLLDVSRADAPAVTIAEQTIKPAWRQVPIAFELSYDPSRIHERRLYVIQVRILEGDRLRFTNTQAYPVITRGHPDKVNVVVKQVRK